MRSSFLLFANRILFVLARRFVEQFANASGRTPQIVKFRIKSRALNYPAGKCETRLRGLTSVQLPLVHEGGLHSSQPGISIPG